MIRPITILGTVALALVASLGCDRARQDTPSSTTTTTGEGVDKGVQKHEPTTTTGAGVDKTSEQLAESKREVAEEKADFMKKRAEYKASVMTDLADADKRIAKLEERVLTEKDPGDRARIEQAIPVVKAKRDAFKRSLDMIDTSTSATWETSKNKVGESWNDLKRSIDDAAR